MIFPPPRAAVSCRWHCMGPAAVQQQCHGHGSHRQPTHLARHWRRAGPGRPAVTCHHLVHCMGEGMFPQAPRHDPSNATCPCSRWGQMACCAQACLARLGESSSVSPRPPFFTPVQFAFAGPTPAAVMEQFTRVVGRPALPPYWTLGWHQCKCVPGGQQNGCCSSSHLLSGKQGLMHLNALHEGSRGDEPPVVGWPPFLGGGEGGGPKNLGSAQLGPIGESAPHPHCRYGYSSVWEVREIVANYSAAGLPLEAQWIDIDQSERGLGSCAGVP